jgi:hypothetical protein
VYKKSYFEGNSINTINFSSWKFYLPDNFYWSLKILSKQHLFLTLFLTSGFSHTLALTPIITCAKLDRN